MAFNGSGVFVRLYNWVNDRNAGILIRADRMDAEMDGMATALTDCVTRDGQSPALANLPMAGFNHTNVGNGTARNHYAALGQQQDGIVNWVIAGGTADAITASYAVVITTLVDGQLCFFRASVANATTTPTFSPNGLTARTITKLGGTALVAGDISAANAEVVLRYNLANTRWELLNPSGTISLGTGVATFLATPSSANLRGALTDETGTGAAVFATAPTITSAILTTIDTTSTAVTQSAIDNSTKLATTAYADRVAGGSWTAYTPTVASTGGTITTSTAAGRWVQIGKTVSFQAVIGITNNGSGSGAVTISLPVASRNQTAIYGQETGISSKTLTGAPLASGTTANFRFYDGTYPGGTGSNQLTIAGTYEVT